MKIAIISIIILAVCYVFYKTYQQSHIDKDISKLISSGAIILDVRTEWEFKDAHIKGAVNIPLSQLRNENLPLDKNRIYITCCSHGLRSIKAVDVLKARGFRYVYNGGPWTELDEKIK